MNVLKPDLQVTIKTLLGKGLSQREIERKTGIDRKTIRRYAQSTSLMRLQEPAHSKSPTQQDVATGSGTPSVENPPPRPPAQQPNFPKHVRSAMWTTSAAAEMMKSGSNHRLHSRNGLRCTSVYQKTSYSESQRTGTLPGTRRRGWEILELSVPERVGNLQSGSAAVGCGSLPSSKHFWPGSGGGVF